MLTINDSAVPSVCLFVRLTVRLFSRVVSIHNNPENLELPAKFQRLQFQLADVDTQDCSPSFAPTFDFVEEARAAGQGMQPLHTPA